MSSTRTVWVTTLASALALLSACSSGQPPASPSAIPTAAGTPTLGQPSSTPTPPAIEPTEGPTLATDPVALPPAAYLGFGSNDTQGELRTYCWLGTCADAFELPPMDQLPAMTLDGSSDYLRLHLEADAEFINWTASYGDDAMDELMPLDSGGEQYDPDTTATLPPLLTEASVAAPPAGDWIVYVVVRAVDGDAHYAWHVTVP